MAQTVTGSVIVIIVCIGAALGLLFVIKRLWVPSARRIHNDAIGPNVSVGTTYAVLIAFMLSGVGSDMQSARLNTEQEANSLVNVYRFARELPEEGDPEVGARVCASDGDRRGDGDGARGRVPRGTRLSRTCGMPSLACSPTAPPNRRSWITRSRN